MRSVLIMLCACSLVLAACGGSGSTTTPQAPALTLTIPNASIASGTSVQVQATANGGASVPASNITWSTSSPTVASVSSTGMITGKLKGNALITGKSGDMTGTVYVQVTQGAPAIVIVYSGDSQTGAKGSRLSDPLCTNVKDAAGNLIIGVAVSYAVMTGGGQLASPTIAVTDPGGISTSGLWTLGPNAGAQTVVASVTGATSVTFTATAQ